MLKVCLGDAEATHLLFQTAQDLARAEAPETVTRAFMTATMTALRKPDGGVSGIASGTYFRRLVAKTLAVKSESGRIYARAISVRTVHQGRH